MYRKFGKRLFDILFSFVVLIIILPLLLIIIFLIFLTDGWPVFYVQQRVGRGGKLFGLVKFRTMYKDADKKGLLTVGGRDPRVTKVGYFLRKYKLDELPQFWNVLKGDMSVVGPRPEVKKYVDLYTEEQRRILELRPGITDWASIKFSNENEILAKYENPEEGYVNEVMQEKISIYMNYQSNLNFYQDILIIFMTFKKIFK